MEVTNWKLISWLTGVAYVPEALHVALLTTELYWNLSSCHMAMRFPQEQMEEGNLDKPRVSSESPGFCFKSFPWNVSRIRFSLGRSRNLLLSKPQWALRSLKWHTYIPEKEARKPLTYTGSFTGRHAETYDWKSAWKASQGFNLI